MGTTEMGLILKYGIPLAIKLLAGGKDQEETEEAVQDAVGGIASGEDVGGVLLSADEQQAQTIIDGMYDVITGATGALSSLIDGLAALFADKKGK